MSLLWAAGRTLILVLGALALAAPLAALTAVASAMASNRGPAARIAHGCLRLLAALPIALFGLGAVRGAGLHGPLVAVLALAVGAYAPLALEIVAARAQLGAATSVQALALGLSPGRVGLHLVWPEVRPAVLAATLRCGARLVGETGLFLWLASDGAGLAVLTPAAVVGPVSTAHLAAALTLALALILAGLAIHAERGRA